MLSSAGIMTGITFAKSQLLAMEIKENAYEILKQNTEYFRARVAANEIPNSLEEYNTGGACLLTNNLDDCILQGDQWYSIYPDPNNVSGSTARAWVIETKILWEDHLVEPGVGYKKEIGFYLKQIDFTTTL